MLSLEFEVALAQRLVSDMLRITKYGGTGREKEVAKKCYNLRSGIKRKRAELVLLMDTELPVAKAYAALKDAPAADKREAIRLEKRASLLKGEIFIACSEICEYWFKEFQTGRSEEALLRERYNLPPVPDDQ